MGIVQMGPPQEIVLLLQQNYGIRNFVETGTFRGGTAAWAASHFTKVITIEGSDSVYRDVQPVLTARSNVESLFGDTREVLPQVIAQLDGDAIFWLDSHWCGMDSFGSSDQCPLLKELEALQQFAHVPYVLIDDARLFLSPPPLPNQRNQWPAIDDVIQSLKRIDPHSYLVVFDDVIASVPAEARELLAEHIQQRNTERWQAQGDGSASTSVWRRLKDWVAP